MLDSTRGPSRRRHIFTGSTNPPQVRAPTPRPHTLPPQRMTSPQPGGSSYQEQEAPHMQSCATWPQKPGTPLLLSTSPYGTNILGPLLFTRPAQSKRQKIPNSISPVHLVPLARPLCGADLLLGQAPLAPPPAARASRTTDRGAWHYRCCRRRTWTPALAQPAGAAPGSRPARGLQAWV